MSVILSTFNMIFKYIVDFQEQKASESEIPRRCEMTLKTLSWHSASWVFSTLDRKGRLS